MAWYVKYQEGLLCQFQYQPMPILKHAKQRWMKWQKILISDKDQAMFLAVFGGIKNNIVFNKKLRALYKPEFFVLAKPLSYVTSRLYCMNRLRHQSFYLLFLILFCSFNSLQAQVVAGFTSPMSRVEKIPLKNTSGQK